MKKYFLKYKTSISDIEEVKKVISEIFDIEFEVRISDYVGLYFLYKGVFADVIRVYKGEFDFEIEVSFISGKSKDRASKYNFMRKSFNNYPNYFECTLDDILE